MPHLPIFKRAPCSEATNQEWKSRIGVNASSCFLSPYPQPFRTVTPYYKPQSCRIPLQRWTLGGKGLSLRGILLKLGRWRQCYMRRISNSHLEQENARTYSRLRAADVPHAVPLIEVPKVSGVIPSTFRLHQSMFYAKHPSQLTKDSIHRSSRGRNDHRAYDHSPFLFYADECKSRETGAECTYS